MDSLGASTQTTQQFRDVLQQSDHDTIVEIKVLIQTVLQEQKSIRDSMRENQTMQVQALAAFKAQTEAIQQGQEARIRKLEDFQLQGSTLQEDVKRLRTDVNNLTTNKSEVLAGWKVIVWLIGSMMGFVSTIILVMSFLFKWHII